MSSSHQRPQVPKETKDTLKKIFMLHSPWRDWRIVGHGRYVVAGGSREPDDDTIMASDSIGREVLSFVPEGGKREFLSLSETMVSFLDANSSF